MERASKRRRALAIARRAGVSDSGLARVLQTLAEEASPVSPLSRKQIAKEERDSLGERTPYGQLIQPVAVPLTNGKEFAWHICNPFALMHFVCANCPSFAELISQRHRQHSSSPESPWRLIIYQDEVTPGNLLKVDNARKVMMFYMSFADLGYEVLSKEAAWFVLGCLSSKVAGQVVGGYSAVMRILLRQCFLGDFDMTSGGVTLPCNPPFVLFAKFGFNLADEAALKAVWCFKGASGTRCCAFCKNIVLPRSSLETFDTTGYLQSVRCTDTALLDPATDDSVWQAADALRLQKPAATSKAAFERLEKNYGLNHVPEGILLDEALRARAGPVTNVMLDWMHCEVVTGVFHTEVHLLLSRLKNVGIDFDSVRAYMEPWRWPALVKGSPVAVFNDKRETASADAFKAGASESLNVYPVLRFMLQAVIAPRGLLRHEIASFLSLADVLDMLQHVKTGVVDPDALHNACVTHLRNFLVAYPTEIPKPKHHFTVHFGDMLRRHGMLLACFVHERRHRLVKTAAEAIHNFHHLERSLLVDLVSMHVSIMEGPDVFRCGTALLQESDAPDRLLAFFGPERCERPVMWARAALVSGVPMRAGDVTLRRDGACCRLAGFLRLEADMFAVAAKWPARGVNLWEQLPDDLELVPLTDVGTLCIWCTAHGSLVHALPLHGKLPR